MQPHQPPALFSNVAAHDSQDRTATAVVGSVAPAIPAFTELSLQFLAAAFALPRLFYRIQGCQGLSHYCHGFSEPVIVYHPKLRPALDRRNLPRRSGQIQFTCDTFYAEGGKHISHVADHQRICRRIDFSHFYVAVCQLAAPQSAFPQFERLAEPERAFEVIPETLPG